MLIRIAVFHQIKLLCALTLCEYTTISLSVLLMGIWVSHFSSDRQSGTPSVLVQVSLGCAPRARIAQWRWVCASSHF